MLITTAGLKIALATGIGSLVIGGAAAAATGQSNASGNGVRALDTVSASSTDSATPTVSDTGTPIASPSASASFSPTKGPNPLGPDAWGLCHAFGNKIWGNAPQPTGTADPAGRKPNNPSVAYANLVAAAASQGFTVDQYCTLVITSHGGANTGLPAAAGHAHQHGHGGGQGAGTGAGTAFTRPGAGHGHSNG